MPRRIMCRPILSWGASILLLTSACAPSSLVNVPPPNAVADPSVVTTVAGATQLYNFAVSIFSNVVGGAISSFDEGYVPGSALWTDELLRVQGGRSGQQTEDERDNTGSDDRGFSTLYGAFHSARIKAQQAREGLRLYAPATSPAWQARLEIMEAYTIVYFAEIFCSGIPLSTVPLVSGSPTYTRGFTTQELYERAAALFDSAVTLAGDSARFAWLAKVGKGRALLGLGRFGDAAAAVSDVPTTFVFVAEMGRTSLAKELNELGNAPQKFQVMDNEGGNGLVWSTDPRTAIVTTPALSGAMKVPAKYAVTASGTLDATVPAPNASIRIADGLEARLIEAEAALALNDVSWLAKLNALRSTCVGVAACAPVPGLTAAALPPLADPGSANTRLDLLMKERAMWLYLTGHRQSDLRRMAHIYQRDPATLWPMGLYLNPGFPPLVQPTATNGALNYGTTVVLQTFKYDIPANPLYTGCFDLNP